MNTFEPQLSWSTMLDPSTRVMLFQEDGIWLAVGVDSGAVTQAASLEDLSKHWQAIGQAAAVLSQNDTGFAPRAVEYEAVWEAGQQVSFLDGLDARLVNHDQFKQAAEAYHQRYQIWRKNA